MYAKENTILEKEHAGGMNAIRAFIAAELPEEVQGQLATLIAQFQKRIPKTVRWVPAHNIHLTLKFLGNVSPTNLDTLVQVIRAEALRYHPMEIVVGGFGAFPNRLRPRVIWVGVTVPPELLELQRGVDRETERLGYLGEERGFSPHLTLGRVSQHATPDEVRRVAGGLNGIQVGELGRVVVKEIVLFRSDLQPGGAVYAPLITAPLAR
jgi:2'-5' RNA ligase